MQDRIEESRLIEALQDDRARLAAQTKELQKYRELIEVQQKEFDEYRMRAQEELHKREVAFLAELKKREELFSEREHNLMGRQAHLTVKQEEAEMVRARLQDEVAVREAKLQSAMAALAQEKERYNEESRKRIERTSKDYVADALQTLANKESQFHAISKIWSGVGAIGLVGAICYFAYLSLGAASIMPAQVTWEFITFTSFKGVFVAALLAGLAKYSFLFSRSYMQESLKNADRRHAINFGKFYLESYGAAADWSQVKEAFEHWNIASSNAFTHSADSSADLSALDKAFRIVEQASKSVSGSTDRSGTRTSV